MFNVRFTSDAIPAISELLASAGLPRPGLTIYREGPIADITRTSTGDVNWSIEHPHPWILSLTNFEGIPDDADEVVIVEGVRVWLLFIPQPGELGVEVSLREGELFVDAILS